MRNNMDNIISLGILDIPEVIEANRSEHVAVVVRSFQELVQLVRMV